MRFTLATIALFGLAMPVQPQGEPATVHKLADCAWLAGVWRNAPDAKTALEEHWSAPANGSMMGMFRMAAPGRPSMFEFQLIEESADGVTLRLRHYGPEMTDRDKAPVRAKLTAATERRLEFTAPEGAQLRRIVYEREGLAGVVVVVETTRAGQPAKFTLKMVRGETK